MYQKNLLIALAAGAFVALTTGVSAQTVQHRRAPLAANQYNDERPPLTVNRRSFLDPGPVAPVGTMNNYVAASTVFNRTTDQTFLRSQFGNELLPAPLQVPGRSGPIVQFETPAFPD